MRCLWLIALLLTLACGARAAQALTPGCTAPMLDVDLRLPAEPGPHDAHQHLLAVEFRNRGSVPCVLGMPSLSFDPNEPSALPYFYDPDHSAAAEAFRAAKGVLAPGGRAYFVVAWSSAPAHGPYGWSACDAHDAFALSWNTVGPASTFFLAQHVWTVHCGQDWVSDLRLGPYTAGRPIGEHWLGYVCALRSQVAEPAPVTTAGLRLLSLDPIQYLQSHANGPLDGGYWGFTPLWLRREAGGLPTCGPGMLRRRESDGNTVETLTHCPASPPQTGPETIRQLFVDPQYFGLPPQSVGPVEYTADVPAPGGLEQASVTLDIRNPDDPMLPDIETTLATCKPGQLQLVASADLGSHWSAPRDYAPPGQVWWRGRAFTLKNTSGAACLIGGVPALQVTSPPGWRPNQYAKAECRDCGDPLYTPLGSRWITLQPGGQAHFLATTQVADAAYAGDCTTIGGLRMQGLGETLPFLTATCGELYISAWREGPYTGHPLAEQPTPAATAGLPVPAQCRPLVTVASGAPVFFGEGAGVSLGVSARPMPYSDGAPILLWVANTSDAPKTVMTCASLQWFVQGGIQVLDAEGHRVLTSQEAKLLATGEKGEHIVPVMACAGNIMIPVPPHSCRTGSYEQQDFGFVQKLGEQYDLPPGRYMLAPKAGWFGTTALDARLPIEVLPN